MDYAWHVVSILNRGDSTVYTHYNNASLDVYFRYIDGDVCLRQF